MFYNSIINQPTICIKTKYNDVLITNLCVHLYTSYNYNSTATILIVFNQSSKQSYTPYNDTFTLCIFLNYVMPLSSSTVCYTVCKDAAHS